MSIPSVSTRGHLENALALQYGWQRAEIPAACSCRKAFSVQHDLSCTKVGFPTLCHNKVRDLTASFLIEVCSNVAVEPDLQQLSGAKLSGASSNGDEGAQMDVAADGFGGKRRESDFFDIWVSTHMPPPTNILHYQPHTRSMNRRKKTPVSPTHS